MSEFNLPSLASPDPRVISHTQVALQMYCNNTTVRNEVASGVFNPKSSQGQGCASSLKMHSITKVITEMVAYVTIKVCQSPSAVPQPQCHTSADLCGTFVHVNMGLHRWDI